MQAASLWADKIGDGGSAAEVYERVLQIDPGNMTASIELEQLYRQRKSWVKLIDLLLARTEFLADAPARIQLLMQMAETYEQQLNDRDNAFVTLQAAFREDYSNDHVAKELERLATATDKWNELIGDYTQVVQGIADPKQAADLWVKIARWYDSALKHVDYAIASAQQALQLDNAHVGALHGAGGLLPQAEALERSGGRRSRATPRSSRSRSRASTSCCSWPTPTRRRSATRRRRRSPTSARWTPTSAASTPSTRSSGSTAARRPGTAWSRCWRRSRRSSTTPSWRSSCKLQVGELWEDRLGDNDRAVEAYKEVLAVDPQNLAALKALDALYQKTGRMEEYLENLEHQLEVSSPEGDRVEIYQRMATVWEEKFGKPDRAAEVLEKILLIDDRNQKAYRDLERLYQQERKWESLVDTYRKHILATNDAKRAHRALHEDGPGLRDRAARSRSRHRRLQRRAQRRDRSRRRARRAWRASTRRPSSGTAPSR